MVLGLQGVYLPSTVLVLQAIYFYFYFSFVGDQTKTSTQPSLGRALNHENSNVYLLLQHTKILQLLFSLLCLRCVYNIFSLGFIEAFDLKRRTC